ncbi:MAG: hypothetical protein V1716_00570 [Candidatus Uhrbacteria bacterium]
MTLARVAGFSFDQILISGFTSTSIEGRMAIIFIPVTDDEIRQVVEVASDLNTRSPPVLTTRILLTTKLVSKKLKTTDILPFGRKAVVGLGENPFAERWLRRFLAESLCQS